MPRRERQLLLARIHRRYRTVEVPIDLGPVKFTFTRIEDPNRVLDEVAAEEDRLHKSTGKRPAADTLHLPYWAELWDSAMGIAQFLVRHMRHPATMGTAEDRPSMVGRVARPTLSGCAGPAGEYSRGGTGGTLSPLPVPPPAGRPGEGSVCESGPSAPLLGNAGEGASGVVLPEPRRNVLDLGCGMGLTGTVAAALGAHVTFADLEPAALLFARLNSLPWKDRVRTHQVNWRTGRLPARYDLIIGADIVYERAQWQYLEPFWRGHLAPGGTVLLGEPGRPTGDDFPTWITARGWTLDRHAESVTTRPQPIRLMVLRNGR